MKMKLECFSCFIEQAARAARLSTENESARIRAVKRAARLISELDTEKPPPEIATGIFRAVSEETGNPDGFKDVKHSSNRAVADLIGSIREAIRSSDDPFETAVKASLCGNIIDYGIFDSFDVESLIREEICKPADKDQIDRMRDIIRGSSRISFLADNAGEIGLDGLMLEEFCEINPGLRIAVMVKSAPIINDATYEDASFFGLENKFKICKTPATVGVNLKNITGEAAETVRLSDYVISKGQANYELLTDNPPERVIYLLRAKCGVVAGHIGVGMNTPVIRVSS